MCVSAGFIREIKEKRESFFLSQSDKTQACRGARRAFGLRNSRLMQNKRASLNIQQEKKLQSEHIGASGLCFCILSFLCSVITLSYLHFYYTLYLGICILARYSFCFYISTTKTKTTDKRVNILSTHCRQAFYLFIMKHSGNEVLQMRHIAAISGEYGEHFQCKHLVQALRALCCETNSDGLHSAQLPWRGCQED